MQESARQAAINGPNNLGNNPNRPGTRLPNVPDGLVKGGLQVAPGVPKNLSSPQTGEDPTLWRGALLPKQTSSDGRKIVTVDQLKPQAVLTWKTFNVGKNTTLKFNQNRGGEDKSQWTAFNKIKDPSGAPSQILGNIEAPGQVYVINPNGILFGGSSQINLHGLVASSLPINDGLIARGLINNPDAQFLFSALPMAAGTKGTPAFTPTPSNAPGGKYGDVEVQAGAVISSPTTSANVGGRVMLVGPNVKNEGTISTPDGQTILAAGLQVGVAPHPSSDARLRGLDVYVGAVTVPPPADEETPPVIPLQPPAGTATNRGLIDAPRANTTIAGKEVNQLGVIDSSTSVTLNGSINLLGSYGARALSCWRKRLVFCPHRHRHRDPRGRERGSDSS
jgi:filamentous hemagglutinin family protein